RRGTRRLGRDAGKNPRRSEAVLIQADLAASTDYASDFRGVAVTFRMGFVGFGEAAFHITKGLREGGLAPVVAYGIHPRTPHPGEKIQARARETGTRLVDSSAELASAADIVISAVTADQAEAAASQTAPYLSSKHLYADLNSVSPKTKQTVGATISRTGA